MTEVAPQRTEKELRLILKTRLGVMGALVMAIKLAVKTAAVALPFTIFFGALGAIGEHTLINQIPVIQALNPDTAKSASEVLALLGVACLLYALLQFRRRERASRVSWWPALLAMPSLFMALCFAFSQSLASNINAFQLAMFISQAWALLWTSFVGGVMVLIQIRSADNISTGKPVEFAAVHKEGFSRSLEMAAIHGGKYTAIALGNQLLIVGIFYALQLAFADLVGVISPEARSMALSGQLTSGMRGRLFRFLLLWFVVAMAGGFGIAVAMQGIDVARDGVIDFTVISLESMVLQQIWLALTGWIYTLGMYAYYSERIKQVRAKRDLRDLLAKAK